MSVGGNAARLTALTRELLLHWRQTQESWQDVKAREFDERFMKELESAVNGAVLRIEALEHTLRAIRTDCE